MLKILPRRVVAVSVLASAIGGLVTGLVFQIEDPSRFLESLVLPRTIAFLVVSGGHAGGPQWAMAIAPAVAVVVNMIVYALVAIGTFRILHLMTKKETNQ
jgi:hypothetical protein